MESFENLSGLESSRRPPGTGWPPRLSSGADAGLGDPYRGELFRSELRRARGSEAIAERAEGAARHSDQVAERRSSRPNRERPDGPREQASRPEPRARLQRELEQREDAGLDQPTGRASDRPTPEVLSTGASPARPASTPAAPEVPSPDPSAAPAPTAPSAVAVHGGGAGVPGAAAPAGRPATAGEPSAPPVTSERSAARAARTTQASRTATPPETRRAAEVLEQLRAAIKPGLRQAVVRLDPAELGSVTIRISVARKGLQGRIEAARPETLELLERHVPELRAALESAGIEVGELELSLSAGDGRKDSEAQAAATRGPRRGAASKPIEEAAPLESVHRPRISDDAIDFYA
jgi:hypothetical protein